MSGPGSDGVQSNARDRRSGLKGCRVGRPNTAHGYGPRLRMIKSAMPYPTPSWSRPPAATARFASLQGGRLRELPPRSRRYGCIVCGRSTEDLPDEEYAELAVMLGPSRRANWGAHVACLDGVVRLDLAEEMRDPRRDR